MSLCDDFKEEKGLIEIGRKGAGHSLYKNDITVEDPTKTG